MESGVVTSALLNSGIFAPGFVNSRIYAPGVIKSGVTAPGILTSRYISSGLAFNDMPIIAAVAPTDKYLQTHRPGQTDYRPGQTDYRHTDSQYLDNYSVIAPSSVERSSVVGAPGSIATDKRVIGATGAVAEAHLVNSGLLSAAPVALNREIVSPIGLRNTGIMAGPGTIKTMLN